MWLYFISVSVAIILSVPLLVISLQLLITLIIRKPSSLINTNDISNQSYKILMPAHNEETIIETTLLALIKQGVAAENIIVIADNCNDDTAKISTQLGTVVLERFNDKSRGKGFALDHGLRYLKSSLPPDVVVILDADCEIDNKSLNLLVTQSYKENKPVQALYMMRNNLQLSLKQRVTGFAWLVKNKLRPIAMHFLQLPITLTGTGMAFPWDHIVNINVAHGNIVEDMQLGIDCTLMGAAPIFCIDAVVYSEFPEQAEAVSTQRTRWEHGHLMTIIQQVPSLFKQAIIRRDWRLLGLVLDISVPPLSLLVLFSVSTLFLLSIYAYFFNNTDALLLAVSCFSLFSVVLVIIWWKFGRDYLTLKELCRIPFYVISKISIYVAFIFNRQQSWIRTSRKVKVKVKVKNK